MSKGANVVAAVLVVLGCGGPSSDPAPSGKRIFVTSSAYGMAVLSLSAADAACANSAAGAGLGGSWTAWFSTTAVDAIDRIADVGPWYLLDRQKAFNNRANLTTTPLVPIDVDELGHTGVAAHVWTQTLLGGTLGWYCAYGSVATCGSTSSTTPWTNAANCDCWPGVTARLYCIEQ